MDDLEDMEDPFEADDRRHQAQMASFQQIAELIGSGFQQLAQQQALASQQQVMVLDKLAGAMAMLAQSFNGLATQNAETAAAVREMIDVMSRPRQGEVVRDEKGIVVGTVTRPYNS